MADIERNFNKDSNKESGKYDPLLELTRLFSGESAEQEMYQSGEYPVLDDGLSAYPSLPEEEPAGYRQAFSPENTANSYDAPFAGLENTSSPFVDGAGDFPFDMPGFPGNFGEAPFENRADETMSASAMADMAGDILAQVFPAADPAPEMPEIQADNNAAFWLREMQKALEDAGLPEPAVLVAEPQPVQPESYPHDVPASLPDSGPPLMAQEQEWPPFEKQNETDRYLAEAGSYFDEFLSENAIHQAEKQHEGAGEPLVAAYGMEDAARGDEAVLDASAMQPVSFASLQEEAFPQQPAWAEAAPVDAPDYGVKADYGMEAAYMPLDESAAVTETELSEAEQEFVDVLNTLDMRGSAGDSESPVMDEETLHEPEVNTIGIESDSIADIDNFDLPVPLYKDDEAKAREHAVLEQEFADIFDQRFQRMAEQADGTEQLSQDGAEFFAAQMPWDEPVTEPVQGEGNADKNAASYDWLTEPAADDNNMPPFREEPSGGRRWFSYGLVVLLVLAGAGAGAYFYAPDLFGGDTAPVIIQAEDGDVRVLPDHDSHANTVTSAVYDNGGNTQNPPQQEQLINSAESPMDIPVGAVAGAEAGSMETMDEGGNIDLPAEKSSAVTPPAHRRAGETAYGDQPPQSTESELDGLSIESLVNEAAAKSLPVYVVPTVGVRPGQERMPAVPAGEEAEVRIAGKAQDRWTETGETAATQGDNVAMTAVKPADARTVTSGIEDTGHTAAAGSQVATGPRIIIPPVPDVRPETPPARDTVSRTVQTEQAARTVAHASGFYVQISSQPSHEGAQASAATAKRQFASILGNSDLVIVNADIPGKGTYYRVRIPVNDRAEASELCGQYQAAGGSCFVVKE